jgi:SAM-dependent methyltransferase
MGSLYEDDAWVYDAAFSWDVQEEVDWLLARLGDGVRDVLEPFCGTGRMFPAFLRRGVAMTGVDLADGMLALARDRLRDHDPTRASLHRADIRDFDLGRRFDGAICPVNSFAHLLDEDAALRHLDRMARHLRPGRRYLVQLDLRGPRDLRLGDPQKQGVWEMDHPRGRVRTTWFVSAFDAARRTETHTSRFEILSGPDEGRVVEAVHEMRQWDWPAWRALVDLSPLEQAAAWDGNHEDRPPIPLGPDLQGRALTWHELELPRSKP